MYALHLQNKINSIVFAFNRFCDDTLTVREPNQISFECLVREPIFSVIGAFENRHFTVHDIKFDKEWKCKKSGGGGDLFSFWSISFN